MSEFEILTLTVSIVGVILLPILFILIRGIVKWTRTEDKLDQVVAKLIEIVKDMEEDRRATDSRLSAIENFFMDLGKERFRGDVRN